MTANSVSDVFDPFAVASQNLGQERIMAQAQYAVAMSEDQAFEIVALAAAWHDAGEAIAGALPGDANNWQRNAAKKGLYDGFLRQVARIADKAGEHDDYRAVGEAAWDAAKNIVRGED